jgi:hypothetical protein
MPFDMGFDFRATLGFVTDPAYGVFVDGSHVYPVTFMNGNGDSLNGGWNTAISEIDNTAGNDPRLAGEQFAAPSILRYFRLDLGSGSAPGAGTYTIDLAGGDTSGGLNEYITVYDTATPVITITNVATSANQYVDATGTVRIATTTWNGTTTDKTFATTTCYLELNTGSPATYTAIAHFRLKVPTAVPPTQNPVSIFLYA